MTKPPRRILVLSVFAAAAAVVPFVAPARAVYADPPADASPADAKSAVERFNGAFATQFTSDKLRAIKVLAKTQHPTVAARLLELVKDKDENVRAAACEGLGAQRTSATKAGPVLLKLATDNDEKPAVVAAATASLGPLGWKRAAKDVEKLIWHDEDPVVCAAFSCFGAWKDPSALRTMTQYFRMFPDEKSFATGSVTVDTGAAGNKDQQAAQSAWRGKYGSQRNWRPRPECSKALQAALKEITGFGFRRPDDLDEYLDDPSKYVDPEKIAERMEEPVRRAVSDAYAAAVAKATEQSKKEIPGDTPNDERAKVYWNILRELRTVILEKHKIRLSDLDVIVAEGKSKGWTK